MTVIPFTVMPHSSRHEHWVLEAAVPPRRADPPQQGDYRLSMHSTVFNSKQTVAGSDKRHAYSVHDVGLYPQRCQIMSEHWWHKCHSLPSTYDQQLYRGHEGNHPRSQNIIYLPGLGTTTSKISKCFLSHPSHRVSGTSHRKTFPSRKMLAPG